MSSIEEQLNNFSSNKNVKKSKFNLSFGGKVLIGLTGGIGVALSVICIPFVAPAFRKYCLPYVPATTTQVENILNLLSKNANKNKKLLDIGSGDGRIVIATAKNGYQSDGVELNTWLVHYSRLSAFRHGVFRNTKFFKKDLWNFDVSPYDYIVIFGVEQMMNDLEKKIINEANSNSRIIACRFPLPNMKPNKAVGTGIDTVWLYEMNK